MRATTLSCSMREAFSGRLRSALDGAGYGHSPTRLARAFNARCPDEQVSYHAARKWLLGEAIPSQSRLVVLATWLHVDPAWLRFGDEGGDDSAPGLAQLAERSGQLDISMLTEGEEEVVRLLVEALLRARERNGRRGDVHAGPDA